MKYLSYLFLALLMTSCSKTPVGVGIRIDNQTGITIDEFELFLSSLTRG